MNSIILPNQLFKDLTELKEKNVKTIYLIEHPVYFTKYKFHPLKLIFHRATMKYYYDYLTKFLPVKYIDFTKIKTDKDYNTIFNSYENNFIFDPVDTYLESKFTKSIKNITPLTPENEKELYAHKRATRNMNKMRRKFTTNYLNELHDKEEKYHLNNANIKEIEERIKHGITSNISERTLRRRITKEYIKKLSKKGKRHLTQTNRNIIEEMVEKELGAFY